jgi:hypothetical protein
MVAPKRLLVYLVMAWLGSAPLSAQDASTNPHGDLPEGLTCLSCHTTDAWSPLRTDLAFDHGESTAFPLEGGHSEATCVSCHEELKFDAQVTSPGDCASCHVDIHRGVFQQQCATCHTTQSFSTLKQGLVHPADFPLEGAHLQTSCESCHLDDSGGAFFPLDTDCLSCHVEDFQNSLLINHVALDFPTDCTQCHSSLAWRDVNEFDHVGLASGFPLVAAHNAIPCASCHTAGDGSVPFNATGPDDCIACHLSNYEGEHAGSGFPTTCLVCHNQSTWDDAQDFDHAAAANGFELLGSHKDLDCTACHVPSGSSVFSPADPDDCVACHLADYQEEHSGSGFPTTCLTCHTMDTWDGAEGFQHSAISSGFELVGSHHEIPCTACHSADGSTTLFSVSSQSDCVGCHQTAFDGQHAGSGYPVTCNACHTETTWTGATVDHAAIANGFTLVGRHETADCAACHVAGTSQLLWTPTSQEDCVACHRPAFDAQHAGSGFPVICAACHTQTTWAGATVDHATIGNGFALVGKHQTAVCTACHVGELFTPIWTPTGQEDCVACHRPAYDAQHTGSGFPETCSACHTQTEWTGATADHAIIGNGFTLVGNHDLLACTACHIPVTLQPIFSPSGPNDCVACHQGTFAQAHTGDSYPTDCLICHQVTTWTGATFDHDGDYFPINSGDHQGTWSSCASCHEVPSDYAAFTCLSCHEHNQTDMDDEHSGVSGYSYDSASCFSCHPSGSS